MLPAASRLPASAYPEDALLLPPEAISSRARKWRQPRSVNEIAEHFDITQQAVSQHLKGLRDAGLVAVRPQGQRRLYMVRPEGLRSVEAFLEELWPAALQRLKRAVEDDAG